MTNQESKRKSFLEATTRLESKRKKLYKQEPERELYDAGKIGYNEYMEMYKARKAEEREKYKDNPLYQDYDDGLITYDEFVQLSR